MSERSYMDLPKSNGTAQSPATPHSPGDETSDDEYQHALEVYLTRFCVTGSLG